MRPRHATVLTLLCVAALLWAPAAHAAWTHSGSGTQWAKARSMPAGTTPTVSVSNRSVTVSWSQATIGGTPVAGYVVQRYDTGGNVQTIGSGCSGTVSALSCTETGVAAGSWKYTVQPKQGNWLGAESPQSASAVVASPALSFSSSTTLTSLPTTMSGSIANYIPNQTVTYRLDNPSTGTVLTGSISPTPVQSSGSATVSVTIPSGTSNGSHSVYAIGSSGDQASASITVAVPITTPAFDVRDASAGGAEVNSTEQWAAAGDGLTFPTGAWATTFGTKYIDYDMNSPLLAGSSVSGANFNFRFAAAAAGETACFYFEVRRISTGAVLATHGSTPTPAGCVTGTTQQTVSTVISEVNTTDLANDVRIRVYGRESASKAMTVDMATVTASTGSTSFTLYPSGYSDVTGTAFPFPWGVAASGDGYQYASASNWNTTFATTRYLKYTFPAYVPSAATVTAATLKNYYRPTTSGKNACWYFEVYAGATLIGTHGSSSSPVSCNSTATYTTDSVPLPEVNTAARANSVVVKMYYDISTTSGTRTTQQDYVNLSITYN
jgi:hypothetical protein